MEEGEKKYFLRLLTGCLGWVINYVASRSLNYLEESIPLTDILRVDERGWPLSPWRWYVFLAHICTWEAYRSVASPEVTGQCGETQIRIDQLSYIFHISTWISIYSIRAIDFYMEAGAILQGRRSHCLYITSSSQK